MSTALFIIPYPYSVHCEIQQTKLAKLHAEFSFSQLYREIRNCGIIPEIREKELKM